MSSYRLVFSNDDIGTGGSMRVQWFTETVDYLNSNGIRATFFWVPMSDGRPNYENTDWMRAIEKAMNAGHDVQWHGLSHDGLEFGVPQRTFREENKPTFDDFEAHQLKWAYEHSYPRIKEKLSEGLRIFEKAFGKPVIFRSPCIGVCDDMYVGLRELGVCHSSSRIINPQSWVYTTRRDLPRPEWDPEFSPYSYKVHGVTEIPLMSDYCHWGVPDDRADDILDLAKSDYARLVEDSCGVGVILSHYNSMHKNWHNTLRFYDKLLEFLIRDYKVEFVTFKELLG